VSVWRVPSGAADRIVVWLDSSAAVGMTRAMLNRRNLSGGTRFMTIYAVVVCALFVLLVFLYDWFFRNHPGVVLSHVASMPTNASQHFYTCTSCGTMLRSLEGDCWCSARIQINSGRRSRPDTPARARVGRAAIRSERGCRPDRRVNPHASRTRSSEGR
jgi:hypothetical protein